MHLRIAYRFAKPCTVIFIVLNVFEVSFFKNNVNPVIGAFMS